MIRIEGLNQVTEIDDKLYNQVKDILKERLSLKLDKTPTKDHLLDPHTISQVLNTKLGIKILAPEVLAALCRIAKENEWNLSLYECKIEINSLPFILLLFLNNFI